MPVNPEGIQHLLSWDGDVGHTYLERVENFKEAARINAPFRPDNPGPHLSEAIDSAIQPAVDGLVILVGTNPNEHIRGYSEIVQLGSKPHVIRPRAPGYPLRFKVAGRTVYAMRVNHPGTEANPFLMDLIHLIIP